MANWEATQTVSEFDAKQAAQAAMDGRAATRTAADGGGILGSLGSLFGGGGLDVVGINAAKVPTMREAIRTSVSNLQAKIGEIDANADASGAYKSEEIQQAVVSYVESVKSYCSALISDLLAFSDKLADVENAWKTSSANFAGNISSSTSGLSDNSTVYTETK